MRLEEATLLVPREWVERSETWLEEGDPVELRGWGETSKGDWRRSSKWRGKQSGTMWCPEARGGKCTRKREDDLSPVVIEREEDREVAIWFDNAEVICNLNKHRFSGVENIKAWLVCAHVEMGGEDLGTASTENSINVFKVCFSTLAWKSHKSKDLGAPYSCLYPSAWHTVFVKPCQILYLSVSPSNVGAHNFPVCSYQQRVERNDRAGLDFSGSF